MLRLNREEVLELLEAAEELAKKFREMASAVRAMPTCVCGRDNTHYDVFHALGAAEYWGCARRDRH